MTPQERQLIDQLFDRLSALESSPRDADAANAIKQASARTPNALYALVQTVLVQDEALRRAHERLEAFENDPTLPDQPSFLDSMRDTLFGSPASHGSVPSVRSADTSRPVWNAGGTGYGQPAQQAGVPFGTPQSAPQSGGSSFLGAAAAAAAGVIGGSLLLNSFRSMMGGSHQGFGDPSSLGSPDRTPWGGDSSNSDLARDAGINDIGNDQHASLFDQSKDDNAQNFNSDNDDDGFDGDVGDTGDGGTDYV